MHAAAAGTAHTAAARPSPFDAPRAPSRGRASCAVGGWVPLARPRRTSLGRRLENDKYTPLITPRTPSITNAMSQLAERSDMPRSSHRMPRIANSRSSVLSNVARCGPRLVQPPRAACPVPSHCRTRASYGFHWCTCFGDDDQLRITLCRGHPFCSRPRTHRLRPGRRTALCYPR